MEELRIETNGTVRILILNRPHRLNAFTDNLSQLLIDALYSASADDDIRAVIITGEGRGFCSGLDLARFQDGSLFLGSRHARLDEFEWVGRLVDSIVHNDKPVIAAMNGVAAGAGLSMALACDFRVMATTATLTTGYIRRALSPDAGMTYFLPRLVGHTKAVELILTGRDVSAIEAQELGLLNAVYDAEVLHTEALRLANSLAASAPIAMTMSKRLLVETYDTSMREQLKKELTYLKQCFQTEDVKEGIQAMMEKRNPSFLGR